MIQSIVKTTGAIAVVVTLFCCNNRGSKMNPTEPLAVLSALPLRNSYSPGVPIEVQVVLKNAGKSLFWYNSRMILNSAHSLPEYRELEAVIKKDSNKKLDFNCKIRVDDIGVEDYKALKPGEAITRKYVISECFDLSSPGKYEIYMIYHDNNKQIITAQLNGPILTSYVESVKVSFKIVP